MSDTIFAVKFIERRKVALGRVMMNIAKLSLKIKASLLVVMLLLASRSTGAERLMHNNVDGQIVSHSLLDIGLEYQDLGEGLQAAYTPTEYAQIFEKRDQECIMIKYLSDGLQITGYIIKPKNPDNQKYPAIIYNRGGNRNFGRITLGTLIYLYKLASAGFIVLASDYRGVDGQGRDEFGGQDLNDVANLIPLAQSLGYVDMKNIFMLGFSRGGIMTYLSIKNRLPIRAAAVVGAPTDIKEDDQDRPEMINIYQKLWPDYDEQSEDCFQRRSAYFWADMIDTPILIIHGREDKRVNFNQSIKMANKLESLHKPYRLLIYDHGDHTVSKYKRERDREILEWFRQHIKIPLKDSI